MAQAAATSVFEKAKEEIGYIWNCSKNVEDLKREYENLENMKKNVQGQIEAAIVNGDRLKFGVQEWVDQAKSPLDEAKKVIDEFEANADKTCLNLGMCMDLGTRYRNGKKAANKDDSLYAQVTKHQKDGERFGSGVSFPTHAPGVLDLYERDTIVNVDTHKRCFENILESIKDHSKQIIGIYGIGGVGKTTLAKDVALEVKSLDLFADVVFITVSHAVDTQRINREVEAAAKRIMKGEKILVILDDVWGNFNLEEVCIPWRKKNCKILLTSRSKFVCETMNAMDDTVATRLISVDSWQSKESWILFKRVVGNRVETNENLKEIAKQIVGGCGGLPLIIQAVGAALKKESIDSWRRALEQLKQRSYKHPKISLAYSNLKLSYEFLKSEEAKLCFLMCSMYPEDHNIPLERLVLYGAGLGIFKNLHSMEDARDRVRDAVKILQSTCLLLDGDYVSSVKMHDVVRDVALTIASEGTDKVLVKAGSIPSHVELWLPTPESVESCTGISLMMNNIAELPDELQIPLLRIFLFQANILKKIPDNFFLGMKEARVLDFGWNPIVSLPPSLVELKNLCMLDFGGTRYLTDISRIGNLKTLQILILNSSGIVIIPQEIGNLVNLRRLEVKECWNLSHVATGVMSKLRLLEELHIDCRVKNGNYESLAEINELSKLTFLDLFVQHINLFPNGVRFTKLKGFVIQIGGEQMYSVAEVVHEKTLILGMGIKDLDTESILQVMELIKLSDGILFHRVKTNNIVSTMYEYCESLDDLTTIMLCECRNLLSLVDSKELGGDNTKKQFFSKLEHLFLLRLEKLHVLWNSPDQYISLKSLVTLHISDCNELVRLFSINVARGLVNLQTLTIQECSSLEEVIWDGDEGDFSMVVFPCLFKIELYHLEKLKSFYAGKVIIRYPSLEKVEIYGCKKMDKWPQTIPNYVHAKIRSFQLALSATSILAWKTQIMTMTCQLLE